MITQCSCAERTVRMAIGVATNRWNTFLVLYNLNPLSVRKLSSTHTLEILLPSQPCDRKNIYVACLCARGALVNGVRRIC